jgi:hypothetical protein
MMRALLLLAAVLALAAVAPVDAGKTGRGEGTAYSGPWEKNKTGKNSCQFGRLPARWEKYYAAIPSHVYKRERDCGKCLKIRGTEKDAPGDWVIVKIVDECASCKGNGDVDLSTTALKEATGYSWDRKDIEWEEVDCPDGSNNRKMLGYAQ